MIFGHNFKHFSNTPIKKYAMFAALRFWFLVLFGLSNIDHVITGTTNFNSLKNEFHQDVNLDKVCNKDWCSQHVKYINIK